MMTSKEPQTRLWVANLNDDLNREEIIHIFEKYGAVHTLIRKGTFSCVEFEHPSEALRAKRGLDGCDYHGRRLNIDWYRGDKLIRSGRLEGKSWWNGQPGQPRHRYRVCVLGLPKTVNKAHVTQLAMEGGFSVVFVDVVVSRFGFVYGVIEYSHHDDYRFALEYMDGRAYTLSDGSCCTLRFIKFAELVDVEKFVKSKALQRPPPPSAPNTATMAYPAAGGHGYPLHSHPHSYHGPPPLAAATAVPPYPAPSATPRDTHPPFMHRIPPSHPAATSAYYNHEPPTTMAGYGPASHLQ